MAEERQPEAARVKKVSSRAQHDQTYKAFYAIVAARLGAAEDAYPGANSALGAGVHGGQLRDPPPKSLGECSAVTAGVVAVTVAECTQLGLSVRSDPLPFPEHAVVDFTSLTVSRSRRVAKRLADYAVNRGWQFRKDAVGS